MSNTSQGRGKYQPLTESELDRLIGACDSPEQRLVVSTLAYCGIRISELHRMKSNDVDFNRRIIRVFANDGRVRVVPLSRYLLPLLSAWFTLHDDFGMSVSTIHRHIKRAATSSGLQKPVTSHVLRLTFDAMATRAGISQATITRVLGHRSRTMYRVLEERDVQPVEDAFRDW